jgi:hypothetical protein
MQSKGEERREFQRLRLDSPVDGQFGQIPVKIIEVGVLGARIQHEGALDESRAELRFAYGKIEIAMRCEVARTAATSSGLRFVAAIGESGDHLRAMLSDLVVRAIEHRYDTSTARLRIRTVDGDKTVRGVDAQFLSYRFDNGSWRRRPVFLPEQPATGFTVAKSEDAQEMQRLCTVYEASDDEGRRLIRLFAELSVSDALQIPPRT